MDCDRAANLISARLDGEPVDDGDAAALDAHLAGCAACRSTAADVELQDAALRRAFAPWRAAAAAIAERVTAMAESSHADDAVRPHGRTMPSWGGRVAAVAAGLAAAVAVITFLYRPAADVTKPPVVKAPATAPATAPSPPPDLPRAIATMAVSTGDVFTCPSGDTAWRPISPGSAVAAGDGVRTGGAAKCEFHLPDGSLVRLNVGTEARFVDARTVDVARGQVWSAARGGSTPLRVSAVDGVTVTAGGPAEPTSRPTGFDLACQPAGRGATTVTVHSGSAGVRGPDGGGVAVVRGGEMLTVGPRASAADAAACVPVADPLRATRWQDELLVRKPPDDPEVLARVGQLLAGIVAERADGGGGTLAAAAPGSVEAGLRGGAVDWCGPLARYARGSPGGADPEARRAAARLLADLAPAARVPDLIGLLSDDDGRVRYHAAAGLARIAGQDLGFSPERCMSERDPAAAAAWRAWWFAANVPNDGQRYK